jgi:hypothetical protein
MMEGKGEEESPGGDRRSYSQSRSNRWDRNRGGKGSGRGNGNENVSEGIGKWDESVIGGRDKLEPIVRLLSDKKLFKLLRISLGVFHPELKRICQR